MPDDDKSNAEADGQRGDRTSAWISIIESVKSPLGLLVLALLVIEGSLAIALISSVEQPDNSEETNIIMYGFVATFVSLMAALVFMFRHDAHGLMGRHGIKALYTKKLRRSDLSRMTAEELGSMDTGIVGEDQPEPRAEVWFDDLRPVLHQTSQYSGPAYFLDVNLHIIDWNIAFELIFSDLVGDLRGRHVKFFIARLSNVKDVMAHAQEFTTRVFRGDMPYVDIEPLCYSSAAYGDVRFLKIATQLHDTDGILRAWSVSLLINRIRWDSFREDLLEQIRSDKLWSIYSAAYDHVLLEFPPYLNLIREVVSVVQQGRSSVADVGAGTGNATRVLLEQDHSVVAVENNLGMLNRLRAKQFPQELLKTVKSSADKLDQLESGSFDAVIMINVLYAVTDPLKCLQDVHRILKPTGVLGFSTTHSEVDLDPLLNSIKSHLRAIGKFDDLSADYQALYDLNKSIETTIARRHTRDDYREWTRLAGFEITKDVPSIYEDAVMMIHARKT